MHAAIAEIPVVSAALVIRIQRCVVSVDVDAGVGNAVVVNVVSATCDLFLRARHHGGRIGRPIIGHCYKKYCDYRERGVCAVVILSEHSV